MMQKASGIWSRRLFACGHDMFQQWIISMQIVYYGSGGRTRTGMPLRAVDFESTVSAISPLRQMESDYSERHNRRQE